MIFPEDGTMEIAISPEEFQRRFDAIAQAERERIRKADEQRKSDIKKAEDRHKEEIEQAMASRKRAVDELYTALAPAANHDADEATTIHSASSDRDAAPEIEEHPPATPTKRRRLRRGEMDDLMPAVVLDCETRTVPGWHEYAERIYPDKDISRGAVRSYADREVDAGNLGIADPGGRGKANPKVYSIENLDYFKRGRERADA